jgi:hypothetical protein
LVLKISPELHAPVCPDAFAKAHNRGHTYYDGMVREWKSGALNADFSVFKTHCPMTPSAVKKLIETGGHFGLKLSTSEFSPTAFKTTFLSIYTCNWMKDFFKLTGKVVHILLISIIMLSNNFPILIR